MRIWLSIRLDAEQKALCEARASDRALDHEDREHVVSSSIPLELPEEVERSLRELLASAKPALAKRLLLDSRRHFAALESSGGKKFQATIKES